MCLKYSGKTVLILGGSSELGLETAKVLAARGLRVSATFYSGKGKIKARAGRVRPVFFDLGDRKTFPGVTAGTYDYLVDLAHTDHEAFVSSASDCEIERYFRANVVNRTILLKDISRKMLVRRSGRLVYVSSAAVNQPADGQGYYVSSKNAVESIYRQLGTELAKKGVSTLCLRYSCLDAGRGKRFLENPPIPPLGPAGVAGQIAYFLSDGSRSINAAAITIDQGLPSCKRGNRDGRN